MTFDESIALTLDPSLDRVELAARLRAGDPHLLEHARALLPALSPVAEAARRDGITAVAWNDPRFPAPLLAIPDHPPALWWRGDPAAARPPAVALVGSRAASAAALEMAFTLGFELAARGVIVVSGLARGVDSAAHRGALDGGRTIAVLGSGLACMYPPEHAALARTIAEHGLVVSEHPPAAPPLAFHFPLRNRIISGLSRAVVVVEAGPGSGSLITAAAALEQGREVMAVPGSALGGRNRGAHGLLRDGAKIVECADDIVEELRLPPAGASARSVSGCADEASVEPPLRDMIPGEACDLEALTARSGLPAARLLPLLLDLELQGKVRRVGGGRFMRVRGPC